MSNKIDVKDINRIVLLEALWKNSKESYYHAQMGMKLKFDSKGAIELERKGGEDGRGYVDYFSGRVIKARIFGKESLIDPYLYDRDNGDGAFKRVVSSI